MVQAARSGVQNIAEGSKASATSKKMELKLTSVARASLKELRLDYEDFLPREESNDRQGLRALESKILSAGVCFRVLALNPILRLHPCLLPSLSMIGSNTARLSVPWLRMRASSCPFKG
jgi:hypothetical protein